MKLLDVCDFIIDCPHSTAKDEGKGYPLIRTPNIGRGRLKLDDVHRVSERVYNERNARGIPQDNDLIFAREAPAGNVAVIKSGEKVCLGQRTVLIRPNPELVDSDYLAYYLLSPQQQYKLLGTANGATVAHVNLPVIRNLEIELPEIDVQHKLGAILTAYDSLIENNRKQIKLLEESAQRLYKEWFVDLRFPGYETTPVVDGVPEGWMSLSLGECISYEIGGGWGEETPTGKCDKEGFVIRGTDFYGITHGDYNVPFRYHSASNLNSRVLSDGDIIFEVSGGSKTEGVARTAYITQKMIDRWQKPVMCASFCKLIRSKDDSSSLYLFNHLQYLRACGKTTEYDKKSASSIVNYRWKDFLSQEYVLMPHSDVLTAYNSLAKPLQDSIVNCSLEIEKVSIVRDRLLPKLMSGELEM